MYQTDGKQIRNQYETELFISLRLPKVHRCAKYLNRRRKQIQNWKTNTNMHKTDDKQIRKYLLKVHSRAKYLNRSLEGEYEIEKKIQNCIKQFEKGNTKLYFLFLFVFQKYIAVRKCQNCWRKQTQNPHHKHKHKIRTINSMRNQIQTPHQKRYEKTNTKVYSKIAQPCKNTKTVNKKSNTKSGGNENTKTY